MGEKKYWLIRPPKVPFRRTVLNVNDSEKDKLYRHVDNRLTQLRMKPPLDYLRELNVKQFNSVEKIRNALSRLMPAHLNSIRRFQWFFITCI